MERILHFAKTYPAVAGIAFFLLALGGLLLFFAVQMHRAGLSLKPLAFFAIFVAIVAGPQIAVHLADALARARGASPLVAAAGSEAKQPVDWSLVFGADADPDLIVDAKLGLQAVLGAAEEAKLSFRASGASSLAARFATEAAAAQAFGMYRHFFGMTDAAGSDLAGWTGQRRAAAGDWCHIARDGRELYAWTGPSRAEVESRRAAALGPAPQARFTARGPVIGRLTRRPILMAGFLIANLAAAVAWFFMGSAWATRVSPDEGLPPVAGEELRRRLLALDRAESPFSVTLDGDGETILVSWKFEDAVWLGAMQASGVRRAHRLALRLDERKREVAVTEYWSRLDAVVSSSNLNLRWMAGLGMSFYEVDYRRQFGAQMGPDGYPTGDVSRAYRFDAQELKAAAVEATLRAGWNWQPKMLDLAGFRSALRDRVEAVR